MNDVTPRTGHLPDDIKNKLRALNKSRRLYVRRIESRVYRGVLTKRQATRIINHIWRDYDALLSTLGLQRGVNIHHGIYYHPCGTIAAYRRHKRKGETPCDPCRLAWNEWMNQYRIKKCLEARNL